MTTPPNPATAGSIRPGHELDQPALEAYLTRSLPGFRRFGGDVRQFEGGQSNPTFFFSDQDGQGYVLRKKPGGVLLPSAHLIEREHRVMAALAATDVPVPRMRVLCADVSVVGTAFYVMDCVPGRICRDPALPGLSTGERTRMYDAMNEVAARIHGVDYAAVGLGDYGKPAHYLPRQVKRWTQQYEAARAKPIEAMDALAAWLSEHVPPEVPATLTHGDLRLDNLMFHPTEPQVVAVLDWELSTLGDPLADIAYNCLAYYLPAKQGPLRGLLGADLAALGIPLEADYVATYARRRGLSGVDGIPHWSFYLAFSLFRVASIVEGVRARAERGQGSSASGLEYGRMTNFLATTGLDVTKRGV